MIIKSEIGKKFRVHIIYENQNYGLNNCLTHYKKDPLIEFYDMSFPDKFGDDGQFISRYDARTLAQHSANTGLILDGGVPSWRIDAKTFMPVIKLARTIACG